MGDAARTGRRGVARSIRVDRSHLGAGRLASIGVLAFSPAVCPSANSRCSRRGMQGCSWNYLMAALFERDDPDLADCLRTIDDPEIGLNIVDLGLVVHATRTSDAIDVKLTLTSRACPLGEMMI